MKEWKKIWYRDRFFLTVLAVVLMIVFMLCHATMKKYANESIEFVRRTLPYWAESGIINVGVSDDLEHIMVTSGGDDTTKGEETVEFVAYALEVGAYYEANYYDIIAAFVFTAVFLGKWILENGGRRKEFVSLLPVRGRNVWIAEFLEGFMLSAVFVCFYIGDSCIQQMRITRACREASAELAMLKETANLDSMILQGGKLFLVILLVYAIFHFTKELVNVPSTLIVLIPLTYFSPTILELSWYILTSEEVDLADLAFPDSALLIIPVILFLVTSYILHTKKDVSPTKVFRFKAAEAVYLFMTFCLSFICFSSGVYDLRVGRLFKGILVFVFSGVITFAVWLLAERKATSLFCLKDRK